MNPLPGVWRGVSEASPGCAAVWTFIPDVLVPAGYTLALCPIDEQPGDGAAGILVDQNGVPTTSTEVIGASNHAAQDSPTISGAAHWMHLREFLHPSFYGRNCVATTLGCG